MSTKAYRQEIERSIAQAVARREKSATAARTSPELLRGVVTNTKGPAKTRIEALGRLMQAEGAEVTPDTALQRLADPKEAPAVRLAAMKLLQHKQIFSSVAAEWAPRFMDALRAALAEPKLRGPALEILSLRKDRKTQELLLDGIRNPKRAIVPVQQALRLLSSDIHADVLKMARSLATEEQSRKNKAVFLEALRILGSDPSSVGRLEEVLANDAQSTEARRVAATALNHLSPESLGTKTAKGMAAGKTAAKTKAKGALAKHLETLQRIRR